MIASTSCARRSTMAGFSLLELVLVVALVGILGAVAATRLFPYVAQAESVAVMRLEGQLRNALMMEAATRIARGQVVRLGELAETNPMRFMLEPPGNYLGELRAPTLELLPRRSWHFDTDSRRLVYRAGRALETVTGSAAISEYRVSLRFEDRDGDDRFTPDSDEFHGVRLEKHAVSQFETQATNSS